MKTKENRNELKQEVDSPRGKLAALSEEELAQVSGGDRHEETTDMHCYNPNCPNPDGLTWVGDYMNGIKYECIYCKELTLMGVRLNEP